MAAAPRRPLLLPVDGGDDDDPLPLNGDDDDGSESGDTSSRGSLLSLTDEYIQQPLLLLAGRVVQTAHRGQARARAVRMAGYLLWVAYVAMAAVAAFAIYTVEQDEGGVDRWLYLVALVFVLASTPLSLFDIHQHLVHYVRPRLQRYAIRVLWAVPVYAVTSCLALRFPGAKVYIETPRDAYEAMAIASFYGMMLEALGPREGVVEGLEDAGGAAALPPPCCCVRWARGEALLARTTLGVLQYVGVRLATTVVALVAEAAGVYRDGVWAWDAAYAYCTVALNCSQLWALLMLAFFYTEFRAELTATRLRFLGKGVSIKLLVFFTFWQGVLLAALQAWGALPDRVGAWSTDDLGRALQDLLICLEVVGFAWAHHVYFSFADFRPDHDAGLARKRGALRAVRDMLPTDVLADARAAVRVLLRLDGGGGGGGGGGGEEAAGAQQPRPPRTSSGGAGASSRAHSLGGASSVALPVDGGGEGDNDGEWAGAANGAAAAAAYAHTVACGEDLGVAIGGTLAVASVGGLRGGREHP